MGNFCNDTSTQEQLLQVKQLKTYNLNLDEWIFMQMNPNIYNVYKKIFKYFPDSFKKLKKKTFEVALNDQNQKDEYKQRLYVGQSSLKNNVGVMIFNHLKVYFIGNWENQKMNGLGIMIDQNTGDYYKGQFYRQQPDGYGEYYNLKEKWIYKGQWKNGKRHGLGELRYGDNKVIYKGSFDNDQRHGAGKMQFYTLSEYDQSLEKPQVKKPLIGRPANKKPNNCYFQGTFREDYAEGKGTLLGINFKYVGQFKKDNIHGIGHTIYQVRNEAQLEVQEYIGQFVDGQKHGYGEYRWNKYGEVYKGMWQKGNIKSKGVLMKLKTN